MNIDNLKDLRNFYKEYVYFINIETFDKIASKFLNLEEALKDNEFITMIKLAGFKKVIFD